MVFSVHISLFVSHSLSFSFFSHSLSLSFAVRTFSMFAPISRQEAEFIQQQAPPSYGQLIAQGIIPPVEDFPTENPNEVKYVI